MLYKIINETANLTKNEILISADTRTRSKHGHKGRIMRKNTNEGKYSFFSQTIFQWNCLSKTLDDSETVCVFKHGLKGLQSLL